MNMHTTMISLAAPDQLILAADESPGTMNSRLEKTGASPTEENRRAWRELIIATPGLGRYISGIILHPETLLQQTSAGKPFVDVLRGANIKIGVKVDEGLTSFGNLPGEQVTKGLEGLPDRLKMYAEQGAVFAKWRAVYSITGSTPSQGLIEESARRLAAYAKDCQDAGLIPIVEPEVLMDGDHNIMRCADVTQGVLNEVFDRLVRANVDPSCMILKPNMATAGNKAKLATPTEVAAATLDAFEHLPTAMPMVAFLSGGQPEEVVNANLAAINMRAQAYEDTRRYTGSFGRSLLGKALELWQGDPKNMVEAQATIASSASRAAPASNGRFVIGMPAAISILLSPHAE